MKLDFLDKVYDADKVENGTWLHLLHPGNSQPLYLDALKAKAENRAPVQAARVLVRSTDSKAFDGYLEAVQRRAFKRAKIGDAKGKQAQRIQTDEVIAELKKERPESFSALAIAFENVSEEQPGEIRPPREDLMVIGGDQHRRWLVDQVLEFAADRGNFGGNVEAEADAA